MSDSRLFVVSLLSFVLACGFFVCEVFVYGSAALTVPVILPLCISSILPSRTTCAPGRHLLCCAGVTAVWMAAVLQSKAYAARLPVPPKQH